LRHKMGWKPTGTGDALVFGSAWHDAQDVVWGGAKQFNQGDLLELSFLAFQETWAEEYGMPLNPTLEQQQRLGARTPMIAKEMLFNYIEHRWTMMQRAQVVAIEQPFAVPLPGVAGVWYVGRLDKVVDYNAQRLVLEHKSTTAYSIDYTFLADYVESWSVSPQVKGYQFGAGLFYGKIDAVWVDAALVHRKKHDGFKFIPISHNRSLLEEWVGGTVQWIKAIMAEEDHYEHVGLSPDVFRKNEESCFGKYGHCQFLDICRSCPDPTALPGVPPGYEVEFWEPFDVLGLDKLAAKGVI
jgi:hypothetical protein